MTLAPETGMNTLTKFLAAWPIESLNTMTLQQYADLSDHNSLCYWLEYGSKDLGEIGGIHLNKFGIWKYKERKEYSEQYTRDKEYAWASKYGRYRDEAFKKIKAHVIEIAQAAGRGDWEAIESADLHSIGKWKIAYLYSNNQLFPVYAKTALLAIANGLGGKYGDGATVLELQNYITGKKPVDKSIIDFAREMWDHHVKGKLFRNYFVVGTKYKDDRGNDTKDVFPEMLATGSIAIGFLYNYDLSQLYGNEENEIISFIDNLKNVDDEDVTREHLRRYFRILLRLKPGDIIALKSHGSHGRLEIIAYAIVVERAGKIYEHRPDKLGHHINVEFLETDIARQTTLTYAGTIHKVDPNKSTHLREIFGPYLQMDNPLFDDADIEDGVHSPKSELPYLRGPVAAKMVNQLHNIIQNHFYDYLLQTYPNEDITVEYGGQVDVLRENDNEMWFYEIKPIENVGSCLREAIGQLLDYAYKYRKQNKKIILVAVGMGDKDSANAIAHMNHYSEFLKVHIEYIQHIAKS